jgi:hypothetical protein
MWKYKEIFKELDNWIYLICASGLLVGTACIYKWLPDAKEIITLTGTLVGICATKIKA